MPINELLTLNSTNLNASTSNKVLLHETIAGIKQIAEYGAKGNGQSNSNHIISKQIEESERNYMTSGENGKAVSDSILTLQTKVPDRFQNSSLALSITSSDLTPYGIRPELYTEEQHLLVHLGSRADKISSGVGFSCQHCHKIFPENRSLQRHALIHRGLRPYRCNECEKSFMLNGDLKRHLRIHSGERPFACDVCGRRFTLKGNLMQHFRTHAPEKQFACTICRKNYSQKDSLHRHIRGHFGEKPYCCSICNKRFSLKGDLGRHSLIHTGHKPHACTMCGRRFALKGNMTQHMRTHLKEPKSNHFGESHDHQPVEVALKVDNPGQFQSPECKVFLTELLPPPKCPAMQNGRGNFSSGTPEISLSSSNCSLPLQQNCEVQRSCMIYCSQCPKMFPSVEGLQDHLKYIHGQTTENIRNICSVCSKEFPTKMDLLQHVCGRRGFFQNCCNICRGNSKHSEEHRDYMCSMCEKSFKNQRNLKLHLKRHETARANFVCTKCGCMFLSKSDHFFHSCQFDHHHHGFVANGMHYTGSLPASKDGGAKELVNETEKVSEDTLPDTKNSSSNNNSAKQGYTDSPGDNACTNLSMVASRYFQPLPACDPIGIPQKNIMCSST